MIELVRIMSNNMQIKKTKGLLVGIWYSMIRIKFQMMLLFWKIVRIEFCWMKAKYRLARLLIGENIEIHENEDD